MLIPADNPQGANAAERVEAVTSMYEKVRCGSLTVQGRKVPINGDLRKLRFACGLSKTEAMVLGPYGRVTSSGHSRDLESYSSCNVW